MRLFKVLRALSFANSAVFTGLLVCWLAIYVVGLRNPPLLDDADTVHAEAARMMLARHDWVTLYIDGNVNPLQGGVPIPMEIIKKPNACSYQPKEGEEAKNAERNQD